MPPLTWRSSNYLATNWVRYYENIPGSTVWCRRPDIDELGWAVIMTPLVVQFPADMRFYTFA